MTYGDLQGNSSVKLNVVELGSWDLKKPVDTFGENMTCDT